MYAMFMKLNLYIILNYVLWTCLEDYFLKITSYDLRITSKLTLRDFP